MWSDYFFYLMGLAEIERNQHILLIILFWGIIILIASAMEFIKNKLIKNSVEKNIDK